MNKLLSALALLAVFLMPSFASAQSFGNHFQQTTVNVPTGSGEARLTIPRQNWPVRVMVSGTYTQSGAVFMLTSFLVSDVPTGSPMMTVPETMVNEQTPACSVTSDPNQAVICYLIPGVVWVAVTDSTSSEPHTLVVSANPGNPLQLRITMWY